MVEKRPKSGYLPDKTLNLLKVHMNTPNIRDFCYKNTQWSIFQAEYTKKLGYSMIFFRKIGKITLFHTKLTSRINTTGRKIQKIGFYGKRSTNFKSFPLQLITQITIIVEHTEKFAQFATLHNTNKLVRNSHVLSQKSGIFSSATAIFSKKHKLFTHKILKQQVITHTSIVKRIMVSVTNMHPSSSNALLCQLVSQTYRLLHKILNK